MGNQYNHPMIATSRRVVENMSWKPPEIGWILLKTDGASKEGYIVGCRGVVRGENEEWICGFSKGSGSCDSYVAELWGAFEGLKFFRARGFNRMELHADSWVVSTTLSSSKIGTTTSRSLLQHIRRLLDMNWEVRICHSYREANACADALANIACDGGFILMLHEHQPIHIRMLFLADLIGVCTLHIVRR